MHQIQFRLVFSWDWDWAVTNQYKFGTGVSWEGKRRSGVHASQTVVYPPTGSTAKDREMSTHAYDPSRSGTIYLYLRQRPLWGSLQRSQTS